MQNEINYDNVEDTQDPEAQKIIDSINNGEEDYSEADDDVELPSDEFKGEEEPEEEKLYVGKFKTLDELKKGVKNLNKELSDTVLNGMSDEALESYYKELQSNFTKGNKYAVDEPKEEQKTDDKPKEANAISQELWQELDATFAEKGGITTEQYNQLEKLGIPSQMVDNYLDGLVAKRNELTRQIYDVTGGEENAKTIKAWADENIDEEYIKYVNTLQGNALISAIKGIKAQYDIANNTTKRIVGNNKSSSSGRYTSQDEYLRDVSDSRYTRDENFRKAVDRKLANSKI